MHHNPNLFMTEDDSGRDRQLVWLRTPGGTSDKLLGHVHETAGAGVVATWTDADGNELIGMPGFASLHLAADALYWFDPPWQSPRSRDALAPADSWVHGTITFRGQTLDDARKVIYPAVASMHEADPTAMVHNEHGNAVLHITNNL